MAAPTLCPSCGSQLLQPLRSQPRSGGGTLIDLRCPECQTWMQEALCDADVEALDRAHAAWRRALSDAYERSVAESMEALAVCFAKALDLDLLSADDFGERRAA